MGTTTEAGGMGGASGRGGIARFMDVVRSGSVVDVQAMVRGSRDLVGATDLKCFGATALIHAVGAEDRAMVDALLELGADINQRSDWWAGSFGVLDSASDEMAAYLLSRGAMLTPHAAARLGKADELWAMLEEDSGLVHARGGDGQTPLHFARDVEIADLLLAHGAEIDALDIDHASTPAQWLGESRPLVAAHLVSRGAAADPFMAVRIGDVALLEKLVGLERDGVNVRVSRERFPAAAPAAGHIYLYTIGEGCSLLHCAASMDRADVIGWLASRGADMNIRGGYDDGTPMHAAAWGNKAGAIGALIDAGAEIDGVSGSLHRNEPIGWAIVGGAVDAVRTLLERGAKVRAAHREDARCGADGGFRHLNPRRPLEAWRTISVMLAKKA